MNIIKYKSLCKNSYSEVYNGSSETYLHEGKTYDIEEEYWSDGHIMRKAIIPVPFGPYSANTHVGFFSINFFDYFYTTNELRDLKLKEIGIYE